MIFLFIVGLLNAASISPDQCSQIEGELIRRFRSVGLQLVGPDRVADLSCHCKTDCPPPLRIYSFKKINEQRQKLLAVPCAEQSKNVSERSVASENETCQKGAEILKQLFDQPRIEKAFYDKHRFEGQGSRLKTCSCPSSLGIYPGELRIYKTLDCNDCSGPGCDCE